MKKKITALCILFAAVFVIHGVTGPLLMFRAIWTGSADPFVLTMQYYFVTVAMAALFYLPLAIWIRHLAKQAQMEGLKVISLVAVIILTTFVTANAIAIPVMLALT